MAIVGNSGTKDPHLHLFYRTADGLKNPLYRIQHENSAYTADYTATFTCDIKRSDPPKKVFVRVETLGRRRASIWKELTSTLKQAVQRRESSL